MTRWFSWDRLRIAPIRTIDIVGGKAIPMLLGFGALFTFVTLWAFRADKPKDSYLGE